MSILNDSHWVTTVYGRSGYGSVSRGIMKELLRRNIKFTFENYDWDSGVTQKSKDYPFEELKKLETPQQYHRITDSKNIIHHRTITVQDIDNPPNHTSDKTNIFMTGYPLTPYAPQFYANVLSQYDAVVTPSDYSKSILRNSLLDIVPPIYTVPWGYDPTKFTLAEENAKKYTDERITPFTFFAAFQWLPLKSPYELINAYLQEFSKEDNVRLMLRVHINESATSHQFITRVIKKWSKRLWKFTGKSDPPLIEHIIKPLSATEMGHFYRASDVFIHASKAEFFGLPVLESMACGTPVISTNWHSIKEFYKDEDFAIQGYKTSTPSNSYNGTIYDAKFGVKIRTPYIAEIRHKMRRAYEMSQEELRKKGLEQYESIKHLTWENTVEKLKEIEI